MTTERNKNTKLWEFFISQAICNFDFSFVSGVKWWIIVPNQPNNLSSMWWNIDKHIIEVNGYFQELDYGHPIEVDKLP